MDERKGILFIATSEDYRQEAIRSAKICKRKSDAPLAIVTNEKSNELETYFDHIIIDSKPKDSYIDKPRNLLKTPFERTLYLDTDIYIDDISALFELLDRFDIAFSIDPNEAEIRNERDVAPSRIPESFPGIQSGVIVYRISDSVEKLVEEWLGLFRSEVHPDQPYLRIALWENDLEFGVFANSKFNCLIGSSMQVSGKVNVFHDTWGLIQDFEHFEKIRNRVNEQEGRRILYISTNGKIIPIKEGIDVFISKIANLLAEQELLDRVVLRYHRNGFSGLIKKLSSKIA